MNVGVGAVRTDGASRSQSASSLQLLAMMRSKRMSAMCRKEILLGNGMTILLLPMLCGQPEHRTQSANITFAYHLACLTYCYAEASVAHIVG